MPIEILMPELGESVHEGTVSRWLKQVGDFVKEDEPVVEIMTDKVNTELQAPASGILVQILVSEGEPVEVFKAMGLIEPNAELAKSMLAGQAAPQVGPAPVAVPPKAASSPPSKSVDRRRWFTPVVRAIAEEHGLTESDLLSIPGSGEGGRVTKKDVLAYLASSKTPSPALVASIPEERASPTIAAGPDQELVKLVGMRKMIAEAMERSAKVPVVSTLVDVDVSTMVKFRELNKEAFAQQHGVKLTYTPFFLKALAETLLEHPYLNAAMQPDGQVLLHKAAHIGVAVSLGEDGSGGLIVPVIRDCQSKTLVDLARELEVVAKKARTNSLTVQDVQGATFTLTNPGSYGAVLGTPMINAPQSGILGVYTIKKVPVIVDDMIAVRSVMNLVLTYDHRLVDGMTAGRFLQAVKRRLEKFEFLK